MRTGVSTDITPRPVELEAKFGEKCRELPFDCRHGMTATHLPDGRVLLAGGTVSTLGRKSVPQVAAEVFDPDSGAIAMTGPLMESRRGHTATLLPDGRVVLIGGHRADWDFARGHPAALATAEIFIPSC
jgi:hypothetical protein